MKTIGPMISILVGILLWGIAAGRVSDVILPSLESVFQNVYLIVTTPENLRAIGITASRLAAGWVLAAGIGVTLGLVMGLVPLAQTLLQPYVVLVQSIPRVSWILLALFWFGIDGSVVIFLLVMTIVPFFVVNVAESIRGVQEERREFMEAYRLPTLVRITDVYLPAVSLALRSAATLSLSVGWKAVVMAELLAAPDGIGAGLSWAQGSFDTSMVMAWTVVISTVALLSHAAFRKMA